MTGAGLLAADPVEVGVVGDGKQPDADVAPLVELVPVRQRTLGGGLHQIVGVGVVEAQRARVAAQARQGVEQLLAEWLRGVHPWLTGGHARLFL